MDHGIQVTFDASDVQSLARWWAALLGYEIEDNHDFVTRLLSEGVIGDSDVVSVEGRLYFADAVAAKDPTGKGPRIYFQQVPEEKSAKNRVHLDIPVDPARLDEEVERLLGVGATLIRYNTQGSHRSASLRDPEGNEFCLH
jgi:catechol 2,3-dioxygenase-like lactoylglutathione lyase family enzyme